MKIFISHSHKDSEIAKQITSELRKNGLNVWNAETEIFPGDNWAEKVSTALEDSDAMIVLITPDSMASRTVQREIGFALGNNSYNNRLIPVFINSEETASMEEIPWILKKLKSVSLSKSEINTEKIGEITEALIK